MLAFAVSRNRPYPMRSTKRKARAPSSTPALLSTCGFSLRKLDLLNLSRLFLYNCSRKRCVLEVRRVSLSLRHCPSQELFDLFANILVGLLLIDEQPRERRDRIRIGAGRVRDRHAKVCRHLVS